MEGERHSTASEPAIISEPAQIAQLEARNTLRQFDKVVQAIDYWSQPDYLPNFRLRASLIRTLHREALVDLSAYAGNYRPAGIEIGGSKHQPVDAHMVEELVEHLCDYVNANWDKSSVHLAAFVLWRLNWIHPFTDGNGRTSRAISYLVLCIRLGYRIPGTKTIPQQIAEDKKPYYAALEAADEAWKSEKLDLSQLESLLGDLLAVQLLSIHEAATNARP